MDKDYIAAVKEALEKLSPKTWKEYVRKRIDFCIQKDLKYPKTRYNEEKDEWELQLPSKSKSKSKSKSQYKYPNGMLLRCIDGILATELRGQKEVTVGLERRAEIAAEAFLMNMMLGEKYGWETKNYQLAEQYQKDFYRGIREAFISELISEDTSQDELIQVGHEYAYEMLCKRNQPTGDVPRIFLPTQPGCYFEELAKFEKMKKQIQIGENETFKVKGPVRVGTDEYKKLIKAMDDRVKYLRSIHRPEDGKFKADRTLKVAILPNKEIWVLPYRFSDGEKSQHSIVAKGNPCVWAGEVDDSEDLKVTRMLRDSGHFRTDDAKKQEEIFQFALSAFDEQGHNTTEITSDEKNEKG